MYPADAGYATLQGAVDEEIDEFDAAFAQLAITLQFESSATILPATRKVFKAIGRTYRGAHAWPELCEHEPGFFPAPLRDEAQLQRTANTLRGLVHLLPWARRDPAGGAVDDGDRAWVTAPPFGPGDLQLQTLPVVRPAPVASPPFDEIAVRRLVGGGRARSGVTWFLDWFTGHDVIDGPEAEGRPYFLCHLLLLDTNSGMLLACELARLSEVAQGLQQVLLQTCERFGLPERLIVRRETVAETLQPLAQRLGIGLNRDAKSVGITRRLYAEITSFLGR
jgi:hypothetical protein